MKYTPLTVGFLQAAGLACYVSLFALIVEWARVQDMHPEPPLGIILFLLAFVISASVCASLMFAYPASLFFANKRGEALRTIFWSLVWLVLFFAAFAVANFL